jgi:hypothetical protein
MNGLAMRAAVCMHWRWMPGMQSCLGRVLLKKGRTYKSSADLYLPGGGSPGNSLLPDLTDPATMGCLLVLVREAWSKPYAHVFRLLDGTGWVCNAGRPIMGATEAEALVAALEEAP